VGRISSAECLWDTGLFLGGRYLCTSLSQYGLANTNIDLDRDKKTRLSKLLHSSTHRKAQKVEEGIIKIAGRGEKGYYESVNGIHFLPSE
jgi:hypothetical protein